jgi:hypothetical protein
MGVATAKAIKSNDEIKLTLIYFFAKDGKMTEDKYKKDNKGNLISEQDGSRYAKAEFYSNKEKKYYLKTYRNGRVGEVICDPYSLLGSPTDLLANNDLYSSRSAEYSLVSEQMLADFIEYLRTRNPSRIRLIERNYLNGDT